MSNKNANSALMISTKLKTTMPARMNEWLLRICMYVYYDIHCNYLQFRHFLVNEKPPKGGYRLLLIRLPDFLP